MNNFWTNIVRYPRFFISSMVGLILVILAPLKNLLKVPKLRILTTVVFILFVTLLIIVLKNMIGV